MSDFVSDFVCLDLFAVRHLFGDDWIRTNGTAVAVSRRAYGLHLEKVFRARALAWFRRSERDTPETYALAQRARTTIAAAEVERTLAKAGRYA